MQRPEPRLVIDILGLNRLPAPALPTLVSYVGARGFRMERELPGPGMRYDVRKGKWEEPTANEREAAMGHRWEAMAHPKVTEAQRRAAMGRAMDLNVMMWILETIRMHLKKKEIARQIECSERYREEGEVERRKQELEWIEEQYEGRIREGWAFMAVEEAPEKMLGAGHSAREEGA
ncbi:unnamed protein product [Closterium sp. Naga37s-1]|nr:unnamed protein product [Closterium sp. Naga37s-1]